MGRSRFVAACGTVVVTSQEEILLIRFGFCAMVANTPENAAYRQWTPSND